MSVRDTERTEVARCAQPGQGTRVITDGAIAGAHFVHTLDSAQVTGVGEHTKVTIPKSDKDGELDPHGANRNSESSAREIPALLGRGARAGPCPLQSCASARSFIPMHILPPTCNAIVRLLFSSARGELQQTHGWTVSAPRSDHPRAPVLTSDLFSRSAEFYVAR